MTSESHSKILIAVAGGIGSGKSVVCRALMAMGFPVYDCDSRAKAIMDSDPVIKGEIAARISPDALNSDGSLDRKVIADVVFADKSKLNALNAIVHGAVRRDIEEWSRSQASHIVFVETAILYQSGIDRMAAHVWEVCAPDSLRIDRVCVRSGFSAEHVKSRMASQQPVGHTPHHSVTVINNDNHHSVLLQIDAALKAIGS